MILSIDLFVVSAYIFTVLSGVRNTRDGRSYFFPPSCFLNPAHQPFVLCSCGSPSLAHWLIKKSLSMPFSSASRRKSSACHLFFACGKYHMRKTKYPIRIYLLSYLIPSRLSTPTPVCQWRNTADDYGRKPLGNPL